MVIPVLVFALWSNSIEDVTTSYEKENVETEISIESDALGRGACIGKVGDRTVLVQVSCWWCSSYTANKKACDKLKELQDEANASVIAP